MNDFIEDRGIAFFAHLLGRLHDHFVRGFAEWNPEVGVAAPPRTHSTMRALRERGPMPVTELAALLRQSHPLVITWVRSLKELGFVQTAQDPSDLRRTFINLTKTGEDEVSRHIVLERATVRAFDELMGEIGGDAFGELWRMEHACRQRPFADRLRHHSNELGLLEGRRASKV